MASALYDLRGVEKFFQRGPATVRALDGVALEIGGRRVRRARGAERLRQDDAAAAARRARPAERRARCSSRDDDLAKLADRELAQLRLRSFGFVFQQFNLIPTLTAVENVEAKLVAGRWRP